MVTTTEPLNKFEEITGYNNYYEFGTGKGDPAKYAGQLKTSPWTVKIDGHLQQAGRLSPRRSDQDRRSRRARLPVPLRRSVVDGDPLGRHSARRRHQARGADAESDLHRDADRAAARTRCPGSASGGLNWPYTEGLRMDEAMNPLSLLAVGLYGKTLMNQNGAPIRLVVPWKYGFKNVKSIVRIRFVDKMPQHRVERRQSRRVRVLFQREPRRSIIRAGARRPSAASRATSRRRRR